jgi:hypothetical protein
VGHDLTKINILWVVQAATCPPLHSARLTDAKFHQVLVSLKRHRTNSPVRCERAGFAGLAYIAGSWVLWPVDRKPSQRMFDNTGDLPERSYSAGASASADGIYLRTRNVSIANG